VAESAAATRKRLSGYERSKERGAQVVTVRLPAGYMKILQTEAGLIRSRRGQFLEQLLLRRRGKINLERSKDAPEYELTRDEIERRALWTWYVSPEFKQMLDDDRFQMGNLPVGSWIIVTLNQWIGRPEGVRIKA
jgi:hypothetical protein